ncbi:MAG TPA: metallophosphoesterase family protein [Gaiellaceae bacterium]|nr:metallophosphoesterase family protein [Gaiellaceae bacterium]
MRIAVVSDIHANLAALEAVLAEIDAESPDELWCLGDLVGYGPRPSECTEAIAARAAICLAGNHDLAVIGKLDLLEFSGEAGDAARWTRGVLTDVARDYLDGLEPAGKRDGIALFHASARDPVWEYVLSDDVAEATLELAGTRLVLVGHSHAALRVAFRDDGSLDGGLAPAGTEVDLAGGRVLLNPGSVGQPRDGDPRAAWLLLDTDAQAAGFRRVAYDIERTQTEIRAAGLPELLAIRLADGL